STATPASLRSRGASSARHWRSTGEKYEKAAGCGGGIAAGDSSSDGLSAAGRRVRPWRQNAPAGISRQPHGPGGTDTEKGGTAMDAGRAVDAFEQQVVGAINKSGLHPVVVRLVLLNLVHVVEDKERELAKQA